jgi:hypothetical protein
MLLSESDFASLSIPAAVSAKIRDMKKRPLSLVRSRSTQKFRRESRTETDEDKYGAKKKKFSSRQTEVVCLLFSFCLVYFGAALYLMGGRDPPSRPFRGKMEKRELLYSNDKEHLGHSHFGSLEPETSDACPVGFCPSVMNGLVACKVCLACPLELREFGSLVKQCPPIVSGQNDVVFMIWTTTASTFSIRNQWSLESLLRQQVPLPPPPPFVRASL